MGEACKIDPVLRERFNAMLRATGSARRGAPTVSVDELLAEVKAGDLGTPLSPDSYSAMADSLKSMYEPSEEGLLQGNIDSIVERLDEVLERQAMAPPSRFYCGQYPHGSFNAQSSLTRDGILMSINSGLLMLVYQALKLVTMATRLTEEDDDKGVRPHGTVKNP